MAKTPNKATKQPSTKKARSNSRARTRIHEVPTLHDILPKKSSSSGKEFARVVNFLLFYNGQRNGKHVTLFDDRAGDYNGLDAFENDTNGLIGYQHKFYPCPLSHKHRYKIREDLLKTYNAEKEVEQNKKKKSRLKKWILVTPDDFVEPSTRKDKGDVSWFENLKNEIDFPFELEHWGHTQLQALFLETPSIGLYYYPELFPDGVNRKKSIEAIRMQYDNAFSEEYSSIEFVGMSVYKEEAARTVPMEKIYIPLSVIPNEAEEDDSSVIRHDPVDFLAPDSQHVVLGDPGSGKTTLLKFLALYGQSEALQKRHWKQLSTSAKEKSFKFRLNSRIPIFITLRRYADALKRNESLSILEYIHTNIEADFSISSVPVEFLEYYIETGNAIFFFDGLDELPKSKFKKIIRDRIRSLITVYPGNTTIVTSRIYGYQDPHRFDKNKFVHYRIAKLQDKEIEQFVHDWYDARLEKAKDRKEYLGSLLKILSNEQHISIRNLARNPLILTIIVLVHRIDAVLPDERHVLYKKCTETLLNTWHTWKFHDTDNLHHAKIDRQNMHRMQFIAHWMHHEMGGEQANQQAVVTYEDLHSNLIKHIKTETPPNRDYAPEDIASDFIEFIQDRAGLIVEIGDRQFSFIHLTFQEYLTAARIKTLAELDGVSSIWKKEIQGHCQDARWREVIRLLVADYSDEAQQFLIDEIINCAGSDANIALLLGGLLLDGVASAYMKIGEIIKSLLKAAIAIEDEDVLRNILATLRACCDKKDETQEIFMDTVQSLYNDAASPSDQHALLLATLSLGISLDKAWKLLGKGSKRENILLSLFAGQPLSLKDLESIKLELDFLWLMLDKAATRSAFHNGLASFFQSLSSNNPLFYAKREFDTLLFIILCRHFRGPIAHFFSHTLVLSPELSDIHFGVSCKNFMTQGKNRVPRALDLNQDLVLAQGLNLDRVQDRIRVREQDRAQERIRVREQDLVLERDRAQERALDRALLDGLKLISIDCDIHAGRTQKFWDNMITNTQINTKLTQFLCAVLNLQPISLWQEALSILFLPTIPERIHLVNPSWWQATKTAFETKKPKKADIYAAGCLLIFDAALYLIGYHETSKDLLKAFDYSIDQIHEHYETANKSKKIFAEIAQMTSQRKEAPLQIAHCIRDICYGDESRIEDLKAMVKSDDKTFRDIFERVYIYKDEDKKSKSTKRKTASKKVKTKRKSS